MVLPKGMDWEPRRGDGASNCIWTQLMNVKGLQRMYEVGHCLSLNAKLFKI